MSKVDAQRAIREARYEAYRKAQAAGAPAAAKPAAAKPVKSEPAAPVEAALTSAELDELEEAEAAPGLCGHKGGSGKPCTRPAGHPEKSHRYK